MREPEGTRGNAREPGAAKPRSERRERVRDLARRLGAAGMCSHDVQHLLGIDPNTAGAILSQMEAGGHLHSDKQHAWPYRAKRWFATPRLVRAFLAAERVAAFRPAHTQCPALPGSAGGAGAPCPNWTHDPRYQCAPGEQVVGGFASMGPGRYLPMDVSTWAAAAIRAGRV